MLRSILIAILLSAAAGAQPFEARVVEDHSGAAVAAASVRLERLAGNARPIDLDTDAGGRFRVAALEPGDYTIQVSKPGYSATAVRLALPGAVTAIRLVRSGTIVGHVTAAEAIPMASVRVFALPRPADGGPLRPLVHAIPVTPNERGDYRLQNLPPGRYAVAMTYEPGAQFYSSGSQPHIIAIGGGGEARADFNVAQSAASSVIGRMELSGRRLRFTVALTPIDRPSLAVETGMPDDYGRFQLRNVPAGSYYLLLSGPPKGRGADADELENDLYFARQRVDVGSRDLTGVQVAVERGRSASFVLRAGSGCPASARVTLSPLEDWGAYLDRTFEVNSTKGTTLVDLAPTQYYVALAQAGSCYLQSPVIDLTGVAGKAPYEFTIKPAGAVQGSLKGASTGRTAVVLAAEGLSQLQVAIPGTDGRFHFDGLRPGRYRLAEVDAKGPWLADLEKMVEVDVKGGETLEIGAGATVRERILP